MKIIADENISMAAEAFSPFGTVELHPGRRITNKMLKDADALVVRSVTNVDEVLLENTNVKFIGTATIGWDHVDIKYLAAKEIAFSTAAGCNSDAVTEYVFTALFHICSKYKISLRDKKLGIIGVGNIGSRVASIASAMGMQVMLNDPPLRRKTGSEKYVPLSDLMDCDILTMHVPLNMSGEDRTFHLIDEKLLALPDKRTVIINTSRGPVVENEPLLLKIKEKNYITVLDVWENEPALNTELLEKVEIGTPHIAGYSEEGKINGTMMIYDALCRFAGYNPGWDYDPGEMTDTILDPDGTGSFEERINSVLKQVYDISSDTLQLKQCLSMDKKEIPAYFDLLRKNYKLRKEFFNYRVEGLAGDDPVRKALTLLRFK